MMFRRSMLANAICSAAALVAAPGAARQLDAPHTDPGYGHNRDGGGHRGVVSGQDTGRRADGDRYRRERCERGASGTIIGAIAGGLLGDTASGSSAGTGAAGRAIDRGC